MLWRPHGRVQWQKSRFRPRSWMHGLRGTENHLGLHCNFHGIASCLHLLLRYRKYADSEYHSSRLRWHVRRSRHSSCCAALSGPDHLHWQGSHRDMQAARTRIAKIFPRCSQHAQKDRTPIITLCVYALLMEQNVQHDLEVSFFVWFRAKDSASHWMSGHHHMNDRSSFLSCINRKQAKHYGSSNRRCSRSFHARCESRRVTSVAFIWINHSVPFLLVGSYYDVFYYWTHLVGCSTIVLIRISLVILSFQKVHFI